MTFLEWVDGPLCPLICCVIHSQTMRNHSFGVRVTANAEYRLEGGRPRLIHSRTMRSATGVFLATGERLCPPRGCGAHSTLFGRRVRPDSVAHPFADHRFRHSATGPVRSPFADSNVIPGCSIRSLASHASQVRKVCRVTSAIAYRISSYSR